MVAERGKQGGIPSAQLQHLGGGFAEVLDCVGAVEGGVAGARDEVVDAVAQLVEEEDEVFVGEEAGRGGGGGWEVADEKGGGVVAGVVGVGEALGEWVSWGAI